MCSGTRILVSKKTDLYSRIKDLPYSPTRPAVLLVGWVGCSGENRRTIPRRSGEWESRGTSPSGAVRAGPPAAQANRAANFNAHECRLEITSFPGRRGFENPYIIRTCIHRPCRFFPEICHRGKPRQPDDVSITHPRRPFVNTASNAASEIP